MDEKEKVDLKELVESIKEEIEDKDIDKLHLEVEEEADKLAKKKCSD
ncbi:MAG: hypothetical protein ACOC53_06765 [Candidatus Saliniplasma sp.]